MPVDVIAVVAAVAADDTAGVVGVVNGTGAVGAGTAVGCCTNRGAVRGVASGGVADAHPDIAMAVPSASHQAVERWNEGAE